MALNEAGPPSRYPRECKGKGRCRDVIEEDAMIHVEQRPQLLELTRADRELVCQGRSPLPTKLGPATWRPVRTKSSPL